MVPVYWKWSQEAELLSLSPSDNRCWSSAERHSPILRLHLPGLPGAPSSPQLPLGVLRTDPSSLLPSLQPLPGSSLWVPCSCLLYHADGVTTIAFLVLSSFLEPVTKPLVCALPLACLPCPHSVRKTRRKPRAAPAAGAVAFPLYWGWTHRRESLDWHGTFRPTSPDPVL